MSVQSEVEEFKRKLLDGQIYQNGVSEEKLERMKELINKAHTKIEEKLPEDEPNCVPDWVCELLIKIGMEANEPERQEPEPSPTEMVRRLLEKGWKLKPGRDLHDQCLEDPKTKILYDFTDKDITMAYCRAFPPKKKVEVEVWLDDEGCVRVMPLNSNSKGLDPRRVSLGWTKGTATFWVEEDSSDEVSKKDKFEFPVKYCPTCSKQMVHGVGHMVTTKVEDSGG